LHTTGSRADEMIRGATSLVSKTSCRAAKLKPAEGFVERDGLAPSLFLAPPLVISDTELGQIFDALHHGLELANTELAASPA
jgi:hypothetical protein